MVWMCKLTRSVTAWGAATLSALAAAPSISHFRITPSRCLPTLNFSTAACGPFNLNARGSHQNSLALISGRTTRRYSQGANATPTPAPAHQSKAKRKNKLARELGVQYVEALSTASWYDIPQLKKRLADVSHEFTVTALHPELDGSVLYVTYTPDMESPKALATSDAFIFDQGEGSWLKLVCSGAFFLLLPLY
jgi:hypothetical protein